MRWASRCCPIVRWKLSPHSGDVRTFSAVDLTGLPSTFTYSQARRLGISDRQLHALRDACLLDQIGRGLYQRTGAAEEAPPDLTEIAIRAERATLCLTTALARHQLTGAVPVGVDVAIPRGHRRPALGIPVVWHTFVTGTFDIGRERLALSGEVVIGLYSPMRCVIDAFRLRHREGTGLAHEALRRWLARADARPAELLAMARSFPKGEPALRAALEILV
jgi:hypothetical protein